MKLLLPLFLALAIDAGCARLAIHGSPNIFNGLLHDAYDHYDRAMAVRRPPLRFVTGQTVHSCKEYLARRPGAKIGAAVNNRVVAQDYLVCDALALLRGAGPPAAAGYRPNSYGQELLRRLDLRGFRSSLRPLLDDSHATLGGLLGAVATVERYAVTVKTADWSYRFEVVADIESATGQHDWLVWLSDEAKDGNYRDYQTLVVANPLPVGPLVATRPGAG